MALLRQADTTIGPNCRTDIVKLIVDGAETVRVALLVLKTRPRVRRLSNSCCADRVCSRWSPVLTTGMPQTTSSTSARTSGSSH